MSDRPNRPKGRDDVIFRQLDDEWVIYDPTGEQLHTLNLTAALVWAHLTGEMSPDEIAEEVGSAFDPPVPADQLLGDVQSAITTLADKGLLL